MHMLERFGQRILPQQKNSLDFEKKIATIQQRKSKQYFLDGYAGYSTALPTAS